MPFLSLLTVPTASLEGVNLADRQGADLCAGCQPTVPEGIDLFILPMNCGSKSLQDLKSFEFL